MKKHLLASYLDGIRDTEKGESYTRFFQYFVPEFITALVIYSLSSLIDAWFIANLKSTATYATLGVTNVLLNFLVKIADGLSVGTIVLAGQFNGAGEFKKVGRVFVDSFWSTVALGGFIAAILYSGAHVIYQLYGVDQEMIALGVPFLRARAVSILFMFIHFAFIGFMRGIKDVKTPMKIFIVGGLVFVFFDYVLIFGKWGFPEMGLQGSAIASAIQYGVMVLCSAWYVFANASRRYYGIRLFRVAGEPHYWGDLFKVSWPVMLDKATMALAYIWLGAMLAPMGQYVLATFSATKDLQQLALLPAIAFGQVVTFLVSNDYRVGRWDDIKSNTKKTVFLSSILVASILIVFSLFPAYFIGFFDKKGDFIGLASRVFPFLAILALFDLLQLVLSGALRGAANVKVVMWARLLICFGYFAPVSYIISRMTFGSEVTKFLLIYGSYYVGHALMSVVYIRRLRGDAWQTMLPREGAK